MINFHKYGFLDAKKLFRYILNKNIWHSRYNPIWLFSWSDLYKPEIAYDNDFCFIRFLMPEIGMCYYPPLGEDIEKGFKMIERDAYENGFDLYIAPIYEDLKLRMTDMKYKILDTQKFDNYIYSLEDFAFNKASKAFKQAIKMFEKEHKKCFYKPIKKEDFPQILEFIENWHLSLKVTRDLSFYSKLNSIKKLIEHLYEFDLIGIMLMDEEKIYGVAIGSVYDNVSFLHLNLTLQDVAGAYEELLMCFSKVALTKSKFLNLEEEVNDINKIKELEDVKPFSVERFYSTFRL